MAQRHPGLALELAVDTLFDVRMKLSSKMSHLGHPRQELAYSSGRTFVALGVNRHPGQVEQPGAGVLPRFPLPGLYVVLSWDRYLNEVIF